MQASALYVAVIFSASLMQGAGPDFFVLRAGAGEPTYRVPNKMLV